VHFIPYEVAVGYDKWCCQHLHPTDSYLSHINPLCSRLYWRNIDARNWGDHADKHRS
jgi:hypothetical protein